MPSESLPPAGRRPSSTGSLEQDTEAAATQTPISICVTFSLIVGFIEENYSAGVSASYLEVSKPDTCESANSSQGVTTAVNSIGFNSSSGSMFSSFT